MSSVRVSEKIRITSPLTVFVKDGQMGFSKAYDSISEHMTFELSDFFAVLSAWVTRPERPKGTQDIVNRPEGSLDISLQNRLLLICLCHVFLFRKDLPAHP